MSLISPNSLNRYPVDQPAAGGSSAPGRPAIPSSPPLNEDEFVRHSGVPLAPGFNPNGRPHPRAPSPRSTALATTKRPPKGRRIRNLYRDADRAIAHWLSGDKGSAVSLMRGINHSSDGRPVSYLIERIAALGDSQLIPILREIASERTDGAVEEAQRGIEVLLQLAEELRQHRAIEGEMGDQRQYANRAISQWTSGDTGPAMSMMRRLNEHSGGVAVSYLIEEIAALGDSQLIPILEEIANVQTGWVADQARQGIDTINDPNEELRHHRAIEREVGTPYRYADRAIAQWMSGDTELAMSMMRRLNEHSEGAPVSYLVEKIVASGDSRLIPMLEEIASAHAYEDVVEARHGITVLRRSGEWWDGHSGPF